MKEIEKFIIEQIKILVPKFKKLEFSAIIGDTSRSIEFFVTINNERFQCYELADNGSINEMQLEKIFEIITTDIRNSNEYNKGVVNKVSFVVEID